VWCELGEGARSALLRRADGYFVVFSRGNAGGLGACVDVVQASSPSWRSLSWSQSLALSRRGVCCFLGPAPDVCFLLRVVLLCLAAWPSFVALVFGRFVHMALHPDAFVFSLIGFPLQTIISILILFYVFKPGVRILFSGKPIESLGPNEQAHFDR